MVSVVAAPTQHPDRALVALRAPILRAQADFQPEHYSHPDLAPLLGGSLGTWADLQDLLAVALSSVGGKLSEDDDGYFNLALSPEL